MKKLYVYSRHHNPISWLIVLVCFLKTFDKNFKVLKFKVLNLFGSFSDPLWILFGSF